MQIDLGFFPLMWILYFISPWLSIDGQAEKKTWGKHWVALPPGHHVFEAWFPYLFSHQQCLGSLAIDLAPGGTYLIKYRPPWLVFLPGKLTLVDRPALPAATVRQLP